MTEDYAGRWHSSLMNNYGTPPITLVRGEGAYVYDETGKRYLDLLAGIAVNALGHGHPAIVEAVSRQVATLAHTSNIYAHPRVVELARTLQDLIAPDATVFFSNSGAEANEAAFKIARLTKRSRVLAAEHGFHGRTMGSLALTGQPDKRAPFEPLPSGVEFYPYGDITALRALVEDGGRADDTAAIFLESIQGETGVVPAPEGFLGDVRALCDEYGILMVVDEVQAGMGRTGRWFGYQAEDVLPDIVTLAKGLGGGMPIGACVAATPAARLLEKGQHGSTFGGNPVACAAGSAVVETIRADGLLEHATAMEALIRDKLTSLDAVAEVRGRGLMLGVVLHDPRPGTAEAAAGKGLLINQPAPDVLRLVPPLTIPEFDVRESLAILKELLS